MRPAPVYRWPGIAALLLLMAGPGRADYFTWSYGTWSSTKNPTTEDGTYGSYILDNSQTVWLNIGVEHIPLSGLAFQASGSHATIPGWNVSAYLPSPGPFTFNPFDGDYRLGLILGDSNGTPQAGVTFSGELSGTLANNQSSLSNTFTSPTTQTTQFGGHTYTATVSYVDGGMKGNSYSAVIQADVIVSPEPSSLLLAGAGMLLAGGAAFRRWRAVRVAAGL